MEAETYLSSGYGIRTAIESRPEGWKKFSELARVWQPSRLKGIQVPREYGTPFLAATQVFDVRPVPRKWLSLDRTDDAANRFVRAGMIFVTCSGSVGHPTLAYAPHEKILISHDLLRIEPIDERDAGWIYGYLHAPQTRAMAVGAHYGHIIKHLEPSHVEALPIPMVNDKTAEAFNRRVERILELRNEGYRLTLEAESRFDSALGSIRIKDWGEQGFAVRASDAFLSGRRRMDATIHNPGVSAIRRHLAKRGQGVTAISAAGYEVWLPTRFRRIPAEDGVALFESAALTEVNPETTKRISDGHFGDPNRGRVEPGWILMARSGQAYGILGSVVLTANDLEGKVISDDVMRIRPRQEATIRPGYLTIALSHPLFGRPLVKALAYGSSIPHIDVSDVLSHEVVRLPEAEESKIATLAEASAKARAGADLLEREMAVDAWRIVEAFIKSIP